jgi:predicted AlkP superfamily pyrophosphatase or phosphodiesterase
MKKNRKILLWFLVFVSVFVITQVSAALKPFDYVFIISIDGARSDIVFSMVEPRNIRCLASEGAYTFWAQSIQPSVTLPAHTSMLTGVKANVHKILWNDYQPEKGYVQVTTIFELAKAANLKTAMFTGKQKLLCIARPGTVDKFEWINGDAIAIARAAAEYIVKEKPNLCFVHLPDLDSFGHNYGWGSDRQIKAVENCDKAVGILLDGLRSAGILDQTFIIVSADHGGHGKTHGSSDVRDICVPFICSGASVKPNYEIQAPVSICDVAATAAYTLGLDIPDTWTGKPVKEIFKEKIGLRITTSETIP